MANILLDLYAAKVLRSLDVSAFWCRFFGRNNKSVASYVHTGKGQRGSISALMLCSYFSDATFGAVQISNCASSNVKRSGNKNTRQAGYVAAIRLSMKMPVAMS
ncbi:MAG: hypothetical protein EON54_22620 [Alcaligenaceae bacterium]|nr:MAG: hypothetical protein EON54_22620 [Alcaligenaceae bacterium]